MEHQLSRTSEEDLVRLWQSDSQSLAARRAAAELLGRYQCRVYRWCFGYVNDHDQALDLVQDVLLTAIQRIDTLRAEARFSTWLFVITRNGCLGEMRRRKVRAVEPLNVDELPASGPNPEADFLERLSEDRLMETMKSALSNIEQEAIYLRYFEKASVDLISRVLHLEEASGARGVLQRARRKLKAALSAQGFDPGPNGGAGL